MSSPFIEMYQLIKSIHLNGPIVDKAYKQQFIAATNDLFDLEIKMKDNQIVIDGSTVKALELITSDQLSHVDFIETLYINETDSHRKESLRISLENVYQSIYQLNKFPAAVINWAMRNQEFDTHILHILFDSIKKQISIGVSYFSLNSIETSLRKIDPYFIKSYKGQVYLIGYCHKHKDIRTFLVSRIKGITETYDAFKKDATITISSLYKHTLGIYLGNQNPQWVKLKCNNELLPILKAHPIHSAQEISLDSSDYFSLKCQLVITEELKRVLLQYGSSVEVLYPESLIEMIKTEADNLIKLYH